jgi:formate hydrogenlyase subunit 4
VIIYSALLKPGGGFRGDVILVALLLLIPPVVQLIGGQSARDLLAQVGARKEGRTIVTYELGSLLAVVATLVHSGTVSFPSFRRGVRRITRSSRASPALLASIALIYCSQAIIGLSSYLIELAGLELLGGAVGTYSGPSLGLFRLMHVLQLTYVPMFLAGVPRRDTASSIGLFIVALIIILGIMLLAQALNSGPGPKRSARSSSIRSCPWARWP